MKRFFVLASFFLLSFAWTQDGLYDPEPPANSAFVRIIHAAPELASISPSIGQVDFKDLSYKTASAYLVLQEGEHDATLAGLQTRVSLNAGNFYTLVLQDQGKGLELMVLQDDINTNLARSLLSLYNLSASESVDMKTADGSQAVITGVTPNTFNSIAVNPIDVDLAAFVSSDSVASFSGLSLERGAAYSMIIMGTDDALEVIWVPSITQ